MPSLNNLVVAAALAFGLVSPGAANAMTYIENVTFDPGSASCGSGGGTTVCIEVVKAPLGFYGVAGDEFQINVTMPSRLSVPGSDASYVFTDVFDAATPTFGGPGSLDAQSTLDMTGYLGPANPITTATLDNRAEYVAAGGFDGPNPGFSMTGFNATIDLLNSDPNPLLGITVGFETSVLEPGVWALLLLGLGMTGAALRQQRRRGATITSTAV